MQHSLFFFLAIGVLLVLGLVSATPLYTVNWAWFATLVLVLALAAFWHRFEKGSKGTRELALVAILSALAAALRVPFAALVNVQPTTFLVMLSGYVFGPEPGFTAGAAAALVSNLFLGQGPWTPWQMLAWGLGGAAAGLWGRCRQGFHPTAFAAVAGVWGFLFGWIMNIWHWAGFIYPLTWKTFLATYMASLPFDAMHAVGNVIFSLVFGPSFYRILARFRDKTIINYRNFEKRGSSPVYILFLLGNTRMKETGKGGMALERELRSDELNNILSLSKELRQQLQGLTKARGQVDADVVTASQKLESALNEYTQIMEQRKNS